jgi:hypothetical protein
MQKTVGRTDRLVRGVVTLGALIGSGVVGFTSGWGIVLLVVAAVAAVTGASGYCPLYSLTGINTCRNGECGTRSGAKTRAGDRSAS